MKKTFSLLAALLATCTLWAQTVEEKEIVNYSFADWADNTSIADKTAGTDYTDTLITKKSKETIVFTLHQTNVYTGGAGKVGATATAPSKYLCGMKTNAGDTATITTSVFASVTTVSYFHRATGSDRGWGLKVKGDGDTDWVTVYSTVTNSNGANTGLINVNRTNVQLKWYNLSIGNYAALSNLVINGNVADNRTFQNFTIDLTQNPYTLPAGVSEGGYSDNGKSFNGSQHGWCWAAFGFKTDGAVKITLGGCTYAAANSAKVVSATTGATLATIDTREVGCYDAAKGTGTVSWTYNSEQADSLVVYCGQYCPYLLVEKCDYIEDLHISYYDQNGGFLGIDTITPGSAFAPKYTVADLTIADGMAFRGWKNAGGKKFNEGDAINEDLALTACVTAVEEAVVGTHYVYNLTNSFFYPEEHELISTTGSFHDGKHGFLVKNGQTLSLVLSPKAYVTYTTCQYSTTNAQLITNQAGDSVSALTADDTTDAVAHSFFYANAAGKNDTLTLTATGDNYIHKIEVYNVQDQLQKDGHVYRLAAGDAASFMMLMPQLQDYDTVYLAAGTYDLGETTLTTISANHVAIIGAGMDSTTVRNCPPTSMESIDKTATIFNSGNYNTFRDFTIQNALDYYATSTGRAVTLHDRGNYTTCYRVRLLSYQDTYYSQKIGAFKYFEECEIHGTVDFICGDGSVYFYSCTLVAEPRKKDGSGNDALTASNADASDKGYVFDRCTVKSLCPIVSLGRSWNNAPKCAYLLTTFDYSAGNFTLQKSGEIERWTLTGMNILPEFFGEYKTVDIAGNVISPAENNVTFTYKETSKQMNTIIDYQKAVELTYPNFFENWDPAYDYQPFPAEETAIDAVSSADDSVRKYMLNGQLIIERDGIRYNALGQIVK